MNYRRLFVIICLTVIIVMDSRQMRRLWLTMCCSEIYVYYNVQMLMILFGFDRLYTNSWVHITNASTNVFRPEDRFSY